MASLHGAPWKLLAARVGGAALACLVACSDNRTEPLFTGSSGNSGMAAVAGAPGGAGATGLGGSITGGAPAGNGGASVGNMGAIGGVAGASGGAPGIAAAGSGGVAGLEGEAGAGGAPPTEPPQKGCLTEHIIDDMEDGNDSICRTDGRVGTWFTTNDQSNGGMQLPPPLAIVRPEQIVDGTDSLYAMHMSGSGWTNWGATIGFNIRSANAQPYDASAFGAITFFAKGTVMGKVRVAFRTRDITPTNLGGTCDTGTGQCFRYHGAELMITESWQQYRIRFEEIARDEGFTGEFQPATLVAIEFRVMNPGSIQPFHLWLDDIAFEMPEP